jgi:hypothetical protein
LAGCLLKNQSKSINESGRLVAGLGHFQSPTISFKGPFNFIGNYFLAEGGGDLTTAPQSRIQAQYGAKLGTSGKLNHQGEITQGSFQWPYLEFFGLGTFAIPGGTPLQQTILRREKVEEIRILQKNVLPSVDLKEIALEGTQGLIVKDAAYLYAPTDNIELKSAKKLLSKGTVQSGFFEGLKTVVKAESAILEGVNQGNALLLLIDHYLKMNGVIGSKLTQVVFPKKTVQPQSKSAVQPQPKPVQPQPKPVQPQPKPGQPQSKPAVQPQSNPVVQLQKPAVQPQPKTVVLKKTTEQGKNQETKTFVLGPNAQFKELEVHNAELAELTGGKGKSLFVESQHLTQNSGKKVSIEEDVLLSVQTATFAKEMEAKNIIVKASEEIDIQKTAALKAASTGTARGRIDLETKKLNVAGDLKASDLDAQAQVGSIASTAKIEMTRSSHIKVDDLVKAGEIKAPISEIESKTLKTTPKSKIVASIQNRITTIDGELAGKTAGRSIHIIANSLETKQTCEMKGTEEVKIFTKNKLKSGGHTTAPLITMVSQKEIETTPTSSTKGENVLVKAPTQKHAGNIEGDTTALLAQRMGMLPSSTTKGNDLLHIEAPQDFKGEGKLISQDKIYADIDDLRKIGHNQCKSLVVKAQKHQNPNDIISGKCPDLTKNESFHLITPNSTNFTEEVNVSCSLGFTAPSITANKDLNSQKDLSLSATQKLDIKENLSAKGTASIQGPSLFVPEGKKWAADNLYAEATRGNILNLGTMQGRSFLGRTAKDHITDQATLHYHRQGKRSVPYYAPAQALGGTGVAYQDNHGHTRKLGLKDVAGGKIINKASHKTAHGDLFQEGKKGISHRAESQYYVSKQSKKRHGVFKHKKKRETIWSTAVGAPVINSIQGRLISHVPEGKLEYIGASTVGRDGDIAIVRDKIRYGYLTTEDRRDVSKSSGWGITKHKRSEKHQVPVITRLVNGSKIDHTSLLRGIHGTGVAIQAPHYRAKAKEKITFDGIYLNHSIREKSRSLTPHFFGSGALQGKSVGSAVLQSDPLGNRMHELSRAKGKVNKFAHGVQAGVQGWQDTITFSEAYLQGNLPTAALERYGNVGITSSRSSMTQNYTTVVPSSLDVDILALESKQGVGFLDGAQVDIQHLLKVRAPSLTLGKATTESHTKAHSSSFGGGINAATGVPYANAGAHSSRSHSKTYQNARITVHNPNGAADLGELETLNFDGGVIKAPRYEGHIHHLNMASYQDELSSRSHGGSISFSGMPSQGMTGSLNLSKSKSHEKKVNQHSGLISTKGFDDKLTIDNLTVTDTVLDPALARQAKKTIFKELKDKSKSSHANISFSGLDLNSPEGFAKSAAKSGAVMAAGYVASKVARELGADDLGASIAGTAAGMIASEAINTLTEPQEIDIPSSPVPGHKPVQPGLKVMGEFSESRNGKNTRIVLIGANPAQMGRDWENISQAASKLNSEAKSIFNSGAAFSFLDEFTDRAVVSDPTQLAIQNILAKGGEDADALLITSHPLFQGILRESQDMTGDVITVKLPPLPGIRENEISYPTLQGQHHKLVSLFLASSKFVSDIDAENPHMAKFAVAGLQAALIGPWKVVQGMAQDYVFGDTIAAFKGAAINLVSEKLSVAQEYVELAANGAWMGVCFVFGNSKQVIDVAKDVQKIVKAEGKVLRKPVQGYHPNPKTLEAFPNAIKVKRKTTVQGGSGLRKRWKDDSAIFEWDSRHGTVEKYTLKGKHLGEFDAKTGKLLKSADPTRRIEP